MADETNNIQGDGGNSQTSTGGAGTTLQEPTTFTQEQVEKQVSDALAAAGRTAEALRQHEASLAQKEADLAEKERQAALAEEEAVKNDPAKLNVLRERRALKEQQAAIAKQKAEIEKERKTVEADRAAIAKQKQERRAEELSAEHGVAKEILMMFGDVESMEKVAAALPKAGQPAGNQQAQNAGFKPFSGRTGGQGVNFDKMTPEEKIRYGLENPGAKT
jgi:membrane protein involved in colicin uptake